MKISNEIFHKIFNKYEMEMESLYKEESACILIFRILPDLCQQVIMRLINVDDCLFLKRHDLEQGMNWSDIFENHYADIMIHIRILFSIKIIPNKDIMVLNSDFKRNMLKIFKNGISDNTNLLHKKKNKSWSECFDNGISSLEKYLLNILNLEGLYFDSENEKIKFLINSGFIKKETDNYFMLTPWALSIMLENRQLQIRSLIIRYIVVQGDRPEDKQKNLEFLKFLFRVCTFEVGAPYSVDNYPEEIKRHFDTFRHFGIVHVKKKKDSKRFYVTPLMKCLFEDVNHIFENQEDYKFLIVESNFKVYAYTNSALEQKIIEFLFEVEYIFPNFIVAHITRNSIRKVLKRGVHHQKILQYMSMHAHPISDYRTEIDKVVYNVPENIAQQVIIWEEEKNAVSAENAIYLFEFADDDHFAKYIEKMKTDKIPILWMNKEKRILILPNNQKTKLALKHLN